MRAPLRTENLGQQIGSAVDNLGLLRERIDAVDKADDLDDALDAIEVAANGIAERANQQQGDTFCELGSLLRRVFYADLALVQRFEVVLEWNVPRRVDEVACLYIWHVRCERRRVLYQLKAEFFEALLCIDHCDRDRRRRMCCARSGAAGADRAALGVCFGKCEATNLDGQVWLRWLADAPFWALPSKLLNS